MITLAQSVIKSEYGVKVSIEDAPKTITKFGRNPDLDAIATISQLGDETYVSDNLINSISSSSASDTMDVTIIGFTISGGAFTEVQQTITLAGQTQVPLPTPLARVIRAFNVGAVNSVGDVHVYQSTATVSGGVPTDLSLAHIKIAETENQTFKCSSTLGDGEYGMVSRVWASIAKKTTASVDFQLQSRDPGGVFQPKAEWSATQSSGVSPLTLEPYIIIPPNSDFRIVGDPSTTNVYATAGFSYIVASEKEN